MGRKFVRVLVFSAGFIATSIAVLLVAYKIRTPQPGENMRAILYLVAAIVVGIIGGLYTLWAYRFGIFMVGVLAGLVLSRYIISIANASFFNDSWARIAFTVVVCLLCGFLATHQERTGIIVITSFYGSYALFVGIDVFAKLGFKESMLYLFQSKIVTVGKPANIYMMMGGAIITAIIGIFVQLKFSDKKY
ncbi:hypothetical protein AYI68_g4091 [Smittium mucronatum]|uniref:Transmembrane protein 198 n=1 Tax=Smittium mucronatum TaxID=133383 RepID=A0A1R0GY33_9FUNG|nr:hypothetical protein AYI68_g4091 [Smittium mucronatum]